MNVQQYSHKPVEVFGHTSVANFACSTTFGPRAVTVQQFMPPVAKVSAGCVKNAMREAQRSHHAGFALVKIFHYDRSGAQKWPGGKPVRASDDGRCR